MRRTLFLVGLTAAAAVAAGSGGAAYAGAIPPWTVTFTASADGSSDAALAQARAAMSQVRGGCTENRAHVDSVGRDEPHHYLATLEASCQTTGNDDDQVFEGYGRGAGDKALAAARANLAKQAGHCVEHAFRVQVLHDEQHAAFFRAEVAATC